MRKYKLSFLIVVMTIGLIACGTNNNNDTDTNSDVSTENTNNQQEGSTSLQSVEDVQLTPEEAMQIFMDTYTGATISSIELDEHNFEYTYEIEGFDDAKEYKAEIDLEKNIIDQEEENREKDDNYQELVFDDYVSHEDALSTASQAQEVQELVPTSWKLEIDDGVATYEIEFENDNQQDVTIVIDAKTGEQLAVDVDD
ncbi:PepSY domain-containing protein [Oceanobacillus sp. 1P07AA]|uniref:PepSY domain-containing protein n=1 Tax=Oceanobacillus sp. 1P07AA TaxID=3132293 RepID=UPI0039A5EC69